MIGPYGCTTISAIEDIGFILVNVQDGHTVDGLATRATRWHVVPRRRVEDGPNVVYVVYVVSLVCLSAWWAVRLTIPCLAYDRGDARVDADVMSHVHSAGLI